MASPSVLGAGHIMRPQDKVSQQPAVGFTRDAFDGPLRGIPHSVILR